MLLKILRIGVIRVRPDWSSPDFKKTSEEKLVQMFHQFPSEFSRNPSVDTGFFMDVAADHNNVDDDDIIK